ncbi:hypothetical protein JR316_0013167 [Psilocybe cubensis]|uniref:SAP domain-containing protein n=2 Tax=Psilocybe cubensis TaxID=181762 RepID=A0A8H8CGV1_PSICU|nr:hypothetical protein JR316_0013167 [Psilocybe cubensis]KAH9474702.1 hypothetical protein JR316_0013167 [Psilocybe cubensis]
MSTTTEILFNSPALHSLKRDQLVKLCKIHSIKASGKNVELIQKLRLHAQTLPKDSPLSIAARSEEHGPIPMQVQEPLPQGLEDEQEMGDDVSYQNSRSRPSEQWEMVMDSIEELDEESSQGTLTSQRTLGHNGGTGEFGTGGSKSTTVSSSIKAIATSLGLKKGNPKSTTTSTSSKKNTPFTPHAVQEPTDELSQMSTPYASLPEATSLPQTDHFTLNDTRMSIDGTEDIPLPGHVLRPGVPAPENARLSMGTGVPATPSRPTTTIRLISNPLSNPGAGVDHSYASGENGTPQLKPFKTSFDITFGSPIPNSSGLNFGGMSIWPPRTEEDVHMRGIYPALSFEDLPPSLEMKPPGTPAKPGDVTVHSPLAIPKSPDVFVFGTPHKLTDDQFRSAAASVLDEVNRKLREDGVKEVNTDIIGNLHPETKKEPPREIKPIPVSKRGEITNKFNRLHEEEFQKMEGIDSLVKRRAERLVPKKLSGDGEKVVLGKKRKSSVLADEGGIGSRRPSVIAPRRASNTRVISNGRRAKAIPGAFDFGNDEGDAEEQEDDRAGKRVKMDPDSALSPDEEAKKQEMAEQRRLELAKEKDAILKKLEANRARRRSSAAHGGLSGRKSGRLSVGKPRQSILVKPKPKPKFGFLSSAKSLVQSVWNRGKASTPVVAGPSQIPKASPTAKPEPVKGKTGPPSFVPTKKSSVAPPRASAAMASGSRGMSTRVSDPKLKADDAKSLSSNKGSIATSTSSRARSPPVAGSSRNSLQSNAGSRTSRTSSIVSPSSRATSIAGTAASRARSPTNVSSIGTRLSSTTGFSSIGDVGSMGVKNIAGRKSVAAKSSVPGSSSSRFSNVSSRLFAPTASSLAKMAKAPLPDASGSNKQTLTSITNSPAVAAASPAPTSSSTFSPRPGGIFSKPLALPPQSCIPTPVKSQLPNDEGATVGGGSSKQEKTTDTTSALSRTRSLNGRKPRISRSKVIARLASQRAAGTSSGGRVASASAIAPRPSNAAGGRVVSGKTRSSLGAKVSRASYGGGTRSRPSVGSSDGVMMSAKKRARQSEYARRKSKVGPLNFDGIAPKGVDVDMN